VVGPEGLEPSTKGL